MPRAEGALLLDQLAIGTIMEPHKTVLADWQRLTEFVRRTGHRMQHGGGLLGAGAGAALGGIAGGGRGAALGALIGGGVGAVGGTATTPVPPPPPYYPQGSQQGSYAAVPPPPPKPSVPVNDCSIPRRCDLAAGMYYGSVMSDARGAGQSDVSIMVTKTAPNTVSVTSNYGRLPPFTIRLTRAMNSIQQVGGSVVFCLDLDKNPYGLNVTVDGAAWGGSRG